MTSPAADAKREGNEHFQNGDFACAYECYTRAIQYDPRDAALYCNRATASARLERPADALLDARIAIKLRPAWSKAYFRAAEALEKVEDMTAAAAFYSEALRLDPTERLVSQRLAAARLASSYPGGETVARTNRRPAHSIGMDGLEGLCDQSRRHLQLWADDPATAPRVISTLAAVPVSERDKLFTDLIERLHELKLMQPASENIFRCTLSTLFLLVPELSARSNGCVPMYLSESPDNLWRLVIKTLAATAAEDQALLANWLPLQEAGEEATIAFGEHGEDEVYFETDDESISRDFATVRRVVLAEFLVAVLETIFEEVTAERFGGLAGNRPE